jgi:HSP20 family protein
MFDLIPWRRKEEEGTTAGSRRIFQREFDDLVERFFGHKPVFSHCLFSRTFSPVVDIAETENDIMVTAEIPGMEQKDLDVNLAGDILTIKGEKKAEHEEKGDNFHRIERSYGSFSRSFALPCEVQEGKAEATYKNGVLSLKLPKSERCKKKAVKIAIH